MSFIRKLKKDEVRFIVTTDDEDRLPDKDLDPECLKAIKKRMDGGSIWAWCVIVVTATWGEFTGRANLGECSYESEKDFITNSGYYEDLCLEAMKDLQKNLETFADGLGPLVTQASLEEWLIERTHSE